MSEWVIILNDKIIKKFSIQDGEKFTIGRDNEADIVLDNTAISRLHISIESAAGIYLVSDLGSTNGTFVNGQKIQTNEPISETAVIEFGKFRLAPATEIDADLKLADSVSANFMGLDEETVFVSSQKPLGPKEKRSGVQSRKSKLTVIEGKAQPGELIIEGKNSLKIGKDPSCDLVVPGFFVAKAQCYMFKRDNQYIIVPQKSWIGTYINGLKISDERKLSDGDMIKISKTTLRFNL